MTAGSPGFGGGGYTNQETRALSSIADGPDSDLSQGQDAQIKMLQGHDYQIKFLAQQMKQAQQGINEANQNPIQQIQQFVSDIIVLFGGGELATGALDFGDLQYFLPAIGALFGFGDGPFPISLFEAAEKLFLGYVVPQQQFVDVINRIIEAWLGVLGIDKKFVKDIESLVTAFGDLFDGVENLFPSFNQFLDALGITGAQLGPLGQALAPVMNLFNGINLSGFESILDFITDAIDPFVNGLTAIINWVNSILAIFGFHGSGGVVNSPIGDITNPFANLLSFFGGINFNALGFNPLVAAETFITSILNPTGLLTTLNDIGAAIQQAFTDFLNALVAFVGPVPIIGGIIQSLATFLGATHTAAGTAQNTASAATTVQSQQTIAKPGYLAMDATADAVFPIANISGPTPQTINVTAAASLIGFIDTPDNGKKSSVIWLGQDKTGLTAFYINVYELDTITGIATLVEASSNILSIVSNALGWNYYNLTNPMTSAVGHVYAVEIVVVGSGTYKIAGLASDWKPANTVSSYPHQLGSYRTTSLTSPPATFSPPYTGVVPWFGLGGFSFAGPLTTPFAGPGTTYTYDIPNWLKYGDCLDVAALGGGSGGQGAVFALPGMGGNAGSWLTRTLIYGVDVPVSTTTLTVTVGQGGAGGFPPTGGPGVNGGDSTITGAGLTTLVAAGGIAPTVSGSHGIPGTGPGDTVLTGVTYPGGGDVGTGAGGAVPGGGGGGAGSYGAGGGGADGKVWIAAYQAGTTP